MSQRELADAIGVHQSRLSKLENCHGGIMRMDVLSAWADALDLRIAITFQDGDIILKFIDLPPTR